MRECEISGDLKNPSRIHIGLKTRRGFPFAAKIISSQFYENKNVWIVTVYQNGIPISSGYKALPWITFEPTQLRFSFELLDCT
jgi:hypothetical protein